MYICVQTDGEDPSSSITSHRTTSFPKAELSTEAGLDEPPTACEKVLYAAKVLPRVSITAEEHLRHEISIMERLHHPRVVNMHANFWEHDRVIIVMDLAPGGDLLGKLNDELGACRLKGETFRGLGGAERGPKYISRQFLDAIGYMHHRKVTHRDLKAENVLICGTHETLGCQLYDVKIADFGLSKKHSKSEVQTPGGGGGTPSYAAPERFKHILDPHHAFNEQVAEFWSFGVLLFLILCGRFPYEIQQGDGIHPVLRKIEFMGLAGESWDLLSVEAQEFVRGLLKTEPDKRLCLDPCRSCLVHPWLEGEGGPTGPPALQRVAGEGGLAGLDTRTRSSFSGMAPETDPFAQAHAHGAVERIRAWTGDAVDRIELHLRDEVMVEAGQLGGDRQMDVPLRPDELIVAVMQETRDAGYLGNSIVFYTSEGRVIGVCGNHAKEAARFAAPSDSQIVGLQFDGSRLVGVHLMPAGTGLGVVAEVNGRSATAVDRVSLQLRSGQVRTYGGDGGRQDGSLQLAEDEFIIAVEQVCREWFLGTALVFYTSKSGIFKIKGVASDRSRHFAAPSGRQICGLHFNGNRLTDVETCAADPGRGSRRRSEMRLRSVGSF